MKNKKMSWRKAVLCIALMVATIVMGINIPVINAQAATAVQGITISCYPLGTGRVNTYTSVNGSYTGYISPNDLMSILEVYGNGWCKVSYPISRGRKTAYAKSSDFFVNTSFSASWKTASGSAVTYRKPNLAGTFGSVSNRDRVIIVGYSNGNQQILYPVTGGVYKLGFVRGSLPVEGSAPATSQRKASIADLCFDYKYYADTYGDLKAAYGYNEAQLRNHWLTYGIKEGRGASPILDLRHYVDKNPDIKNAYGTNYAAAYNHFLQYGYKEYRNSSQYYFGLYYRSAYADLMPYDSEFLLNHYIQYGIGEQRQANTVKYVPSDQSASFQMPLENARCTWRGYTNMSWANNRYGNGYSSQRVYHLGIDIIGTSDNVMACGSGTVAAAGYNNANGNYVIIRHTISGQTVYSFYAHLASVCVSANTTVSKGQKIGVVGNTGSASGGKHLHFAIMNKLWSKGSYYGYSTYFTGDKRTYGDVTYYNPVYVIQNNRLP